MLIIIKTSLVVAKEVIGTYALTEPQLIICYFV